MTTQHADRDTAFQAAVLPFLEIAYKNGEALGQHVAMLTDRLATTRGLPQVYGTQAAVIDGRAVLKEIADSAGLERAPPRMSNHLPPNHTPSGRNHAKAQRREDFDILTVTLRRFLDLVVDLVLAAAETEAVVGKEFSLPRRLAVQQNRLVAD